MKSAVVRRWRSLKSVHPADSRDRLQPPEPDGVFVRRWGPEFGMPAYLQAIVDEKAALALAGMKRKAAAAPPKPPSPYGELF